MKLPSDNKLLLSWVLSHKYCLFVIIELFIVCEVRNTGRHITHSGRNYAYICLQSFYVCHQSVSECQPVAIHILKCISSQCYIMCICVYKVVIRHSTVFNNAYLQFKSLYLSHRCVTVYLHVVFEFMCTAFGPPECVNSSVAGRGHKGGWTGVTACVVMAHSESAGKH